MYQHCPQRKSESPSTQEFPRGPAGSTAPNSSLLWSWFPAALQAPGRKPVKPMAVGPAGPVPNLPTLLRAPQTAVQEASWGFSLNREKTVAVRACLRTPGLPEPQGPSGETSVLQLNNHLIKAHHRNCRLTATSLAPAGFARILRPCEFCAVVSMVFDSVCTPHCLLAPEGAWRSGPPRTGAARAPGLGAPLCDAVLLRQ